MQLQDADFAFSKRLVELWCWLMRWVATLAPLLHHEIMDVSLSDLIELPVYASGSSKASSLEDGCFGKCREETVAVI